MHSHYNQVKCVYIWINTVIEHKSIKNFMLGDGIMSGIYLS